LYLSIEIFETVELAAENICFFYIILFLFSRFREEIRIVLRQEQVKQEWDMFVL